MLKYRILCIILMIAGLIGLSLSLFAYENLPLQYISSAMILVGLFGNAGIAIYVAEEASHRKGGITMKKVQIVFLIALLILLVITIDLGRNYFLALDPAINDGITCRSIFHISGVFEPFGDHWTLDSFRLAFVRSLRLTLLVFWGNIALLCCDWWEKKHHDREKKSSGGINMRKAANWALGIALAVFIIDRGILGVKLLDHNYNFTVEAYIGLVCFIVIIICSFIRIFTARCPHCGELLRLTEGAYCSYCGKKIRDN